MNLIALPLEIVNKIFSFLDPYDVYNCKCVCSALNLEATRWLGKCQAIETFSLPTIKAILPSNVMNGRIIDERERYPELFEVMMELLKSNRMMNKDTIHEYPRRRLCEVYTNDLYWCYFKEKNRYHHMIPPNLGRYIKTSLGNSRRDHIFTFVTFHRNLKSVVKPIYASIPVAGLMIEQNSNIFDLGDEILDFDRSCFEKIPKAPDPFKYKISIVKNLNAFNINQWTTKAKIISTNWESGHSLSCKDLYDPDYPIKSFICFKTIPFSCEGLEFLVKNKDIIVSDVLLNQWSTLYIKPQKPQKWYKKKSNPQILSIAFAGKNVKAATLSIESFYSNTRAEQLIAFRQSLDFPINDGRIVGFIFVGGYLFKPDALSEILISIHKTFPRVNFMDISCWDPGKFPTVEQGLIEETPDPSWIVTPFLEETRMPIGDDEE